MEENKFKTGQEVLVRINKDYPWKYDLYSHYDNIKNYFCTISGYWAECIPYKNNEYLVGTTDSPKEDDLPIGTPVMTCNILTDWRFGYYAGNNNVSTRKEDISGKGNIYLINMNFIIPVDKFDFNNPENSLKYNLVK